MGFHPLDPLTPDEIKLAVSIAKEAFASSLGEKIRFEMIELKEPPKQAVRTWQPGQALDRQARVNVTEKGKIGVYKLIVSLTDKKVLKNDHLAEARPMIPLEEFVAIEETVKVDERFIAACKKRGIEDMSLVCVDPWSGAAFPGEGEEGKHVCHAFCWVRVSKDDNYYAHPIEGLNPVVDISTLEIIRIDDYGVVPIPQELSNYERMFTKETDMRSDVKALNVVQPEGVSFQIVGQELTWLDWKFRIGFNAREALTFHDMRFQNRSVCYRMSLSEMAVPYGDPSNGHYRKNVFDMGEYGLGKLTNSLALGCDCLGAIQYLDAHMNTFEGDVTTVEKAVCIHEEDVGIEWKHWDWRTDRSEVRRRRRLVVSNIAVVGNYDYALYWYFHQDGTIEFEIKATGIINTVGCVPGTPQKYGIEVLPGVVGQIHQHHFCVRLDMAVDGDENTVVQCDTYEEDDEANPHGNAYYIKETPIETECGRTRNADTERFWKITSSKKQNAMGKPTAYKIHPTNAVRLFTKPNSVSGRRMPFLYNHLWVTKYDEEERFPGGDFMNNSDGSDGVHEWVKKSRSVKDEDLVVWYVFGLHHLPRLEDFPVQPVVSTGFHMYPAGFSDRNPTLNLPYAVNTASKPACACKENGKTNGHA